MEADESFVLVGDRKSLPQVFISTEAETGPYSLRQRYSSCSSSVGTPKCTTPPVSTSTPHHTVATLPDTEVHLSYKGHHFTAVKLDESITVDSGYQGFRSSKGSLITSRSNLSLSGSNTSLWDTLVASPVQNLREKLKGRPSYLDEGRNHKRLRINPQTVLVWLFIVIFIFSILLVFMVSVNYMIKKKVTGDTFDKNEDLQEISSDLELNIFEADMSEIELDFQDVNAFEEKQVLNDGQIEIEETSYEKLEDNEFLKTEAMETQNSETIDPYSKKIIAEIEAAVLNKLAVNVQKLLASQEKNVAEESAPEMISVVQVAELLEAGIAKKIDDSKLSKKKSKNVNPLIKNVPVLKQSKPKLLSVTKGEDREQVVKREVQVEKFRKPEVADEQVDLVDGDSKDTEVRSRRGVSEDEVVLGEKFRKQKDGGDGGFRKQDDVTQERVKRDIEEETFAFGKTKEKAKKLNESIILSNVISEDTVNVSANVK